MRLLIIRHGDPDYEIDSLTETGRREAALLAEELSSLPIAAIYQSPLGRARDTAAYTLEKLGMTAETLPWLREFDARVMRPDKGRPTIAWDWLPQDLSPVDDFYGETSWMNPPVMAESDVREKYQAVADGMDQLLALHGYRREGRCYRAEQPNHDIIALFCHFGVESVILSHVLNISPVPLWHGFCALPTAVTTLYTEERRQGIASFRCTDFGALTHLRRAGAEPSFSARFCECWTDDTRHD